MEEMVDKRNAIASWSGYNYQGKVGIFLGLNKLSSLLSKGENFKEYSIVFEGAEDVDIKKGDCTESRHQIKAYKNGKYPSSYKGVREINSEAAKSGFNISGVDENSRYLHTACEVNGWNLSEKKFKEQYPKASFVSNESKVELYCYPDGKYYCELIPKLKSDDSPIDVFCKNEIKNVLVIKKNLLKDDNDHIEETLCAIKDCLCHKINVAHMEGNGAVAVINLAVLYKLVTSTEKRKRQAIHRAKARFELYWNKKFSDGENAILLNEILNLSNEKFEQFFIELCPHKIIDKNDIDSLLDQDAFDDIFCEFFKNTNFRNFDVNSLVYTTGDFSKWRLSMINRRPAKVGEVIEEIINNRSFLRASFETDYLINGQINEQPFLKLSRGIDVGDLQSNYSPNLNTTIFDSIFSINLKFIDIDETVKKLRGDANA